MAGGGGFSWNGGAGALRTRKRKRDITWPNEEQKKTKIQKLEEVVEVVKKRKEEMKRKLIEPMEAKVKAEISGG